jgi:hypothetical protein
MLTSVGDGESFYFIFCEIVRNCAFYRENFNQLARAKDCMFLAKLFGTSVLFISKIFSEMLFLGLKVAQNC